MMAMERWKKNVMIKIKHLQRNEILELDKPYGVDILLNKQKQTIVIS